MTDSRTEETKISLDQLDRFGRFADTCENLRAALELPMPAQFHVATMRDALASFAADIKSLYVEVSGENPWE